MARYLVENSRPRQIVTLFGKVLASHISSRRNRPGQMWLSESQYASAPVQRLLELQRLRIVEVDPEDDGPVDVPVEPAPLLEEPPAEVVIENGPVEEPSTEDEVVEEEPEAPAPTPAPPVQPAEPATPAVPPAAQADPPPHHDAPASAVDASPAHEAPHAAPAVPATPAQPAAPAPTTEAVRYTREELESLTFQELRGLAKTLGLSSGGKAAEIVARILAAQETP